MYKVFVGLDISKGSFISCAIGRQQDKIVEFSAHMNMEGFRKLTENLSKFPKDSILIGLESSGCYHINLSSFLSSSGYHTVVINPLLISNFMKLSLRKTKTDKKDAFAIARFLAMFHDSLPGSCFLSPDFPELLKATNVYSRAILNLLKHCPSARMIKSLPASEVARLIEPQIRGRKLEISPEKLISLAKNSIAFMNPAKEFILSQKASQLLLFEEQMERLTDMLVEMCREFALEDLEILKSIKGIGDVTALHFLAEVGDVSRFENPKNLSLMPDLIRPSINPGNSRGKAESPIGATGTSGVSSGS